MASRDRDYWLKYDWLHGSALFTPVRRKTEASGQAKAQDPAPDQLCLESSATTSSFKSDVTVFDPSSGRSPHEDGITGLASITFNKSDCSRTWCFDPSPTSVTGTLREERAHAALHEDSDVAGCSLEQERPSCGVGLVIGQTGAEACEVEGLIEGASAHACGLIRQGDTLLYVGE